MLDTYLREAVLRRAAAFGAYFETRLQVQKSLVKQLETGRIASVKDIFGSEYRRRGISSLFRNLCRG